MAAIRPGRVVMSSGWFLPVPISRARREINDSKARIDKEVLLSRSLPPCTAVRYLVENTLGMAAARPPDSALRKRFEYW